MVKGNGVTICDGVHIGEHVVIGENVYIDFGAIIRDHVVIGDNSYIGTHCILGEYVSDFFENFTNQKHDLIIGEHAVIRSETIIYGDTQIGSYFQTGHRVTIREKSNIGNHVRIGTLSDVQGDCEIQDYVNMHSNVHIGQKSLIKKYAWIFPYSVLTNDPNPPSTELIGAVIEEFAIVATGSIILAGVVIGKEALIGAGALVTKNVSPGRVAVGTPAKEISDITAVKNKITGEEVYPWRYHFERGMPWANIGYDEWLEQNQVCVKDSVRHIHLRRLMNQDAVGMLEWIRDKDLCNGFRFDSSQYTEEDAERFILTSMSDTNKHYAVTDDTNEYLGTISLKNIDGEQAEYAIALRRKAIGTEVSKNATYEIFKIAFEELNLDRVYLNVLADNIRAIKLYKKAGFKYIVGRDSKISVNGEVKELKWYSMERVHYEKIRRTV